MGIGKSVFGLDYFLMIIFLFLIVVIEQLQGQLYTIKTLHHKYKLNVVLLRLFFLVLFIMAAFRGMDVANDTASYYETYKKILNYGIFSEQRMEWGYVLLNGALAKLFPTGETGFYVLLFISSLVSYLPLEKWIEVHSNSYGMAIIAFYFFQNHTYMSAIRQSMAIGIILLSLMAFENGQTIKSILLLILACTFHSSAIVAILFYLMYNIKFSVSKLYLAVGTAFFLVLTNLISKIVLLVKPGTSYLVNEAGNITSAVVTCGIYLILLCLQSLCYKNVDENITSTPRSFKIDFFSLCIVANLFFAILSLKGPGIIRLGMYFTIAGLPYISNIMDKISNKRTRSIIKILFSLLAWLYSFVVFVFRPEWAHVWPFYFYWQTK